jgi:hypothetical protein
MIMKELMNKIFAKDNLLPFCFMVLPFMVILVTTPIGRAGITIHISHHFALFIFGVAMATMLVKNKWLSSFVIYACIWTLFILIYTVKNPQVPQIVTRNAFDALTFLLSGILIYALVIRSKISNDTFYNLICISALLQAGLAICQYLWIDPFLWLINAGFHMAIPRLDPHTLTGTLGNNNFLAAYLAIALPFFFRKGWFYGLILLIPCLILANTASAVVPAIVGTMFYFYPKVKDNRKTIIYAGALFASLALYYVTTYHPISIDGNGRFPFWGEALSQIRYNLFTMICGMGPGAGWGRSFPLHNEWLQCLHQYGAIGLSLLVGYALTAYRGNRMLFTAFIIILINMIGNYSLHLAPSAFLIIITTGLMEREKINA